MPYLELTVSLHSTGKLESQADVELPTPDTHSPTDVSAGDGVIDVVQRESAEESARKVEKVVPEITGQHLGRPPELIAVPAATLPKSLQQRAEAQPTKLELDATAVHRSIARSSISPANVADSAAPAAKVVLAEDQAGVDALAVPRSQVNIEPAYPPDLLARRIEGVVKLQVSISAQGGVLQLKVQESSGHDRLDRAALEAVQTWQFVPARRGTRAIDSTLIVPVRFRIAN